MVSLTCAGHTTSLYDNHIRAVKKNKKHLPDANDPVFVMCPLSFVIRLPDGDLVNLRWTWW